MLVGDRIRELRSQRDLSQADLEQRTGLLRCYISRVENGHTVPALETLEKFARALEVPLYFLVYDGEEPPQEMPLSAIPGEESAWGRTGQAAKFLRKLVPLISRMDDQGREFILAMAQQMASRERRKA